MLDYDAVQATNVVILTDLVAEDIEPEPIGPDLPAPGDLLFEEFYYSGAAPNGGTAHYFSDQFIELINAAS